MSGRERKEGGRNRMAGEGRREKGRRRERGWDKVKGIGGWKEGKSKGNRRVERKSKGNRRGMKVW